MDQQISYWKGNKLHRRIEDSNFLNWSNGIFCSTSGLHPYKQQSDEKPYSRNSLGP